MHDPVRPPRGAEVTSDAGPSPDQMPRAVRSHPGVTLLELLVALVLLGMGAAVVAPVLRLPAPRSADGDAVARARALALRRAEAMTLAIGRDGAWSVRTTRGEPDEPLASGTMPASRADSLPALLAVSPLGDCLPVVAPAIGGAWDPVRCTVATK